MIRFGVLKTIEGKLDEAIKGLEVPCKVDDAVMTENWAPSKIGFTIGTPNGKGMFANDHKRHFVEFNKMNGDLMRIVRDDDGATIFPKT
jgi:hypothetical protein